MQVRIKLMGRDYSKHKEEFKEIMRRHGLRWMGTFQDPWWGNDRERISAYYERDEDRSITISATLTWEGNVETDLIGELRDWADGVGAQVDKVNAVAGDRGGGRVLLDDLKIYEMVYKPQVAYLEATGRPRTWIKKDLERWEAEKAKRFGGTNKA